MPPRADDANRSRVGTVHSMQNKQTDVQRSPQNTQDLYIDPESKVMCCPHLSRRFGMSSSATIVISTHGLCKRFDSFTAVDHLDLEIRKGCIFGLLGPNGAGKSTTIKILTTLLNASAGECHVAGFDVAHAPIDVRRHIGYVPQLLSADGSLTATENLDLSARLHGLYGHERRTQVAAALAFSGLQEHGDQLVKAFSGGMVRRLEIAQATLHGPDVLFLDEPTIGLDPAARRTVWEHLLHLRQSRGMTILICTHDMEEAETLCDEVGIMHQGRLAVVGPPQALKAQVGPQATLADAFVHFSGAAIEANRHPSDVRQGRDAVLLRG